MSRMPRLQLARYGVAVPSVVVALLLSHLLWTLVEPNPFILFWPAVAISAWRGGLGAGLLATFLTVVTVDVFFLQPEPTYIDGLSHLLRLGLFALLAGLISWLHEGRKRAEDALRQSRDQLQVILQGVTDGITAQDTSGKLVFANDAAARVTGYPTAEMFMRAPISEIFSKFELRDEEGNSLGPDRLPGRRALQEGETGELTVQFRLLETGEERWSAVKAKPVFDDEGKVRLAINIFQDITGIKQAESRLRAEGERFRVTLASIGDAVIATDTASCIEFINPVAEALTGWTQAEAAGKPLGEVFRIINEDTRQPVENPVERVMREGAVVGLANHTRLIARDGSEKPIDNSGAPIRNARGEIMGAVLVFRDVTARRESQAQQERLVKEMQRQRDQLNRIIATVPGVVWESYGQPDAPDQRITFVSDYVEMMLGYPKEEWLSTPTMWLKLVHPEDQASAAARDRNTYATGQPGTNQFRWMAKDGRVLWAEAHSSVMRDETGAPIGMSGVTMDISERKQVEAALREEVETVDTINRIGQLLSAELDMEKLVQAVTDAATELSGAEFGAFFYNVIDQHGEAYLLYTISGVPRERFASFPMPRNTEVFGPTFRGEGVVRLDDVKQDPRYGKNEPFFGMPEGHLPVTSYLAVPVVLRSGEVLGGLFFGHSKPCVFTERAERIVVGLAAQAAIAMDNARLYEAAQQERTQAQVAERMYRFMAETIPAIVWTAGPDGKTDYCNQRWYDYTGLTVAETLADGWSKALHPNDVEDTLHLWRTAVETGAPFEVEHRVRRAADGEYRWHLGRALSMCDSSGRIIKWFGTTTDIHDQKQAQEAERFLAEASALLSSSLEYETTLKNLADLLVPYLADWCSIDLLNEQGNIQHVAIVHRDPEMVRLGMEMRHRYPGDPNSPRGLYQVIRSGCSELVEHIPDELVVAAARDEEHLEVIRRLGLKSYMVVPLTVSERVLGAISFVYAESGRRYSAQQLAVAEDLARRAALAVDSARLYRAAQQELAQRRRMEEDLLVVNRELSTFTYIFSHDLRAPLVNLKGFTAELDSAVQVIESSMAPALPHLGESRVTALKRAMHEDIPEALKFLEAAVSRMDYLTSAVLELSRLGRRELHLERMDVNELVQNVLNSLGFQIKEKQVNVTVSELSSVVADRMAMEQILGNIVTNAVVYLSPKRPGMIEIRGERQSEQTVFHVRDNGRGIARSDYNKVFEPFRRAGNHSVSGEGLGLAYVQTLVRRHGGRIWFESELDKGTTFSFTISHELEREAMLKAEKQY